MSGISSKEIDFVYKKGTKFYGKHFIYFYLPFESLQVSPVVSKKISKKAVVRNKIKRRIRALAREFFKTGKFVVVAKSDVSNVEFNELKNDFKKISNKVY